jgi:hypothetical protein
MQQRAVLGKFEHRRRRRAALAGRRVERRGFFIRRQRLRPLDDPDVVVSVNGHARCLPHDPVVGQRLRPGGVSLEARRVRG